MSVVIRKSHPDSEWTTVQVPITVSHDNDGLNSVISAIIFSCRFDCFRHALLKFVAPFAERESMADLTETELFVSP